MARGGMGRPRGSVIWTRDKIPAPGDFVVLLFCEGDDFRERNPAGTGRPVRGLHPFPANRVRSWFHLFSLSAGSHQSPISEISTLARSFLPWVRESPIGGSLPLPWNVRTGAYAPRGPIPEGFSNRFSRKRGNQAAATALNYFAYNFIKIHRALRASPVLAAGVTDRLWGVADLAALRESCPQPRAENSGGKEAVLAIVGASRCCRTRNVVPASRLFRSQTGHPQRSLGGIAFSILRADLSLLRAKEFRAKDATDFKVAHSPMGRLLPSHTHRITVDGRIYS